MPTFMRRMLKWLLILPLCAAGLLMLLVSGCQSKLIYYPRSYASGTVAQWQQATRGVCVDYSTSDGPQRSYLQGNLKTPRHLWIVCCGNGSTAMDWAAWFATQPVPDDAYLLFDYPGYGACNGKPGIAGIEESLTAVVPAAWRQLGWSGEVDGRRLRFFGHSLGAAAALIVARQHGIRKGVLMSPFTRMRDMADLRLGLPLGFLITQRYDNLAGMADLQKRGDARVVILHGARDESIPVAMGRQLKASHPDIVELVEIPQGHHNNLLLEAPQQILTAMRDVAK
ncbi:MAG TPA: alpha/beta hydrolase [Luteolibacter sp.]|nr:alpha/beta hydrolase [Luteolibacter sp.]